MSGWRGGSQAKFVKCMKESVLRYLYDQILESFVRLKELSAVQNEDESNEFTDDLEHMHELLAKRDLLIFAATLRNFAESTETANLMKTKPVTMSELYLSSGWPFHRDIRSTRAKNSKKPNLYQIVSRILHAHNIDILSSQYAMLARLSTTTDNYFALISEYANKQDRYVEPIILISTKDEPLSFVLLSRILGASQAYLNDTISKLENSKIYIARWFRDS